MYCPKTLNETFPYTITKIDYTMVPMGFHGTWYKLGIVQTYLERIIDNFGRTSAIAQNLAEPVTFAERIPQSPSNVIYLIKDVEGNWGLGEFIGMLNVGRKHLRFSNDEGKLYEVEPLCILDFYIREDHRRNGHGKSLFDHMLEDQHTSLHKLAINNLSPIMESFLKGKFGMEGLIKQANNFAVTPKFFDHIEEIKLEAQILYETLQKSRY